MRQQPPTKTTIRRLRLSQIRTDADTQSRARIDEATVGEYAGRMIVGDPFPAIVVFHRDSTYILADGFHRVCAARMAQLETLLADVRHGTRTDALKYSLASNHTHGLRRTNEDKQHAVTLALREFAHLSDRLIADLCGVSHPVVGQLRRQLVKFTSWQKRAGKDGKMRRLPTTADTESREQTLPPSPPLGKGARESGQGGLPIHSFGLPTKCSVG